MTRERALIIISEGDERASITRERALVQGLLRFPMHHVESDPEPSPVGRFEMPSQTLADEVRELRLQPHEHLRTNVISEMWKAGMARINARRMKKGHAHGTTAV